jgi:predicted RNA binding protein YcfA (HicA-like mRNA interferase family)
VSGRQPRITAAQLLRALERDGWTIVRQRGGHAQLKHPTKKGRVTVPMHPGVILNPRTLSTALEQAGLSVANLRRLL